MNVALFTKYFSLMKTQEVQKDLMIEKPQPNNKTLIMLIRNALFMMFLAK